MSFNSILIGVSTVDDRHVYHLLLNVGFRGGGFYSTDEVEIACDPGHLHERSQWQPFDTFMAEEMLPKKDRLCMDCSRDIVRSIKDIHFEKED